MGEKAEKALYEIKTILTPEEWLEVALLALDQAGLKIAEQQKVQKLLVEMGYE